MDTFLTYVPLLIGVLFGSLILLTGYIGMPGSPPDNISDYSSLGEKDVFEGRSDAKVTIVEFSDYQCPACGYFATKTLPYLREKYISTGDVRLVFRNFPISSHEHSFEAAEAAECAGVQGRFQGMHDMIFENQDDIDADNLHTWASNVGLDMGGFTKCMAAGETASGVKGDVALGTAIGVRATPTFFINGRVVEGVPSDEVFDSLIGGELSR